MAVMALMALSLVPRIALAHTPGLSTATFDVELATGRVEGRFVFAAAEFEGTRTAREDLRAFLADGVEVSADGSPCPPVSFDASVNEVDGLVLSSAFACPRHPASVRVILYYLSALSPGHREVVRITAGSATSEAILTRERRALSITSPEPPAVTHRPRKGPLLVAVSLIFAVLMLGLFVWRFLAARRPAASSPGFDHAPAKSRRRAVSSPPQSP
jgi:hypothetical protein